MSYQKHIHQKYGEIWVSEDPDNSSLYMGIIDLVDSDFRKGMGAKLCIIINDQTRKKDLMDAWQEIDETRKLIRGFQGSDSRWRSSILLECVRLREGNHPVSYGQITKMVNFHIYMRLREIAATRLDIDKAIEVNARVYIKEIIQIYKDFMLDEYLANEYIKNDLADLDKFIPILTPEKRYIEVDRVRRSIEEHIKRTNSFLVLDPRFSAINNSQTENKPKGFKPFEFILRSGKEIDDDYEKIKSSLKNRKK